MDTHWGCQCGAQGRIMRTVKAGIGAMSQNMCPAYPRLWVPSQPLYGLRMNLWDMSYWMSLNGREWENTFVVSIISEKKYIHWLWVKNQHSGMKFGRRQERREPTEELGKNSREARTYLDQQSLEWIGSVWKKKTGVCGEGNSVRAEMRKIPSSTVLERTVRIKNQTGIGQ